MDEDSITFLQPAQMQFFMLDTSAWQNQQMVLASFSGPFVVVLSRVLVLSSRVVVAQVPTSTLLSLAFFALLRTFRIFFLLPALGHFLKKTRRKLDSM